jgi:hypothetical protein
MARGAATFSSAVDGARHQSASEEAEAHDHRAATAVDGRAHQPDPVGADRSDADTAGRHVDKPEGNRGTVTVTEAS